MTNEMKAIEEYLKFLREYCEKDNIDDMAKLYVITLEIAFVGFLSKHGVNVNEKTKEEKE